MKIGFYIYRYFICFFYLICCALSVNASDDYYYSLYMLAQPDSPLGALKCERGKKEFGLFLSSRNYPEFPVCEGSEPFISQVKEWYGKIESEQGKDFYYRKMAGDLFLFGDSGVDFFMVDPEFFKVAAESCRGDEDGWDPLDMGEQTIAAGEETKIVTLKDFEYSFLDPFTASQQARNKQSHKLQWIADTEQGCYECCVRDGAKWQYWPDDKQFRFIAAAGTQNDTLVFEKLAARGDYTRLTQNLSSAKAPQHKPVLSNHRSIASDRSIASRGEAGTTGTRPVSSQKSTKEEKSLSSSELIEAARRGVQGATISTEFGDEAVSDMEYLNELMKVVPPESTAAAWMQGKEKK